MNVLDLHSNGSFCNSEKTPDYLFEDGDITQLELCVSELKGIIYSLGLSDKALDFMESAADKVGFRVGEIELSSKFYSVCNQAINTYRSAFNVLFSMAIIGSKTAEDSYYIDCLKERFNVMLVRAKNLSLLQCDA